MKKSKGKLYLIPTPLGDGVTKTLPEYIKPVTYSLTNFIVEKEKTARGFLKSIQYPVPFESVELHPLNKRTTLDEALHYVQKIADGTSMGLLSDAGLPCIGDPGAQVVELAHQYDITVVPLVGPSSILLALIASGMNGQNFAFNGYLPIKSHERKKRVSDLEQLSFKNQQTQIFIETPYRNKQLLEDILESCKQDTRLCIACNLTLSDEFVKTLPIEKWKKVKYDFHKKQAVFLLSRN